MLVLVSARIGSNGLQLGVDGNYPERTEPYEQTPKVADLGLATNQEQTVKGPRCEMVIVRLLDGSL